MQSIRRLFYKIAGVSLMLEKNAFIFDNLCSLTQSTHLPCSTIATSL